MNKIKLYINESKDEVSEIFIEPPIHINQNAEKIALQRNYENLGNAIILQALRDMEVLRDMEAFGFRYYAICSPYKVFEEGTEINKQCQKYTNIDLQWIKRAFDSGKIDMHKKQISRR